MNTCKRHRFPPDIISYAVWLYYRFTPSHRDIENLLATRGIIVTRESIRRWCIKFRAVYAKRLKRNHHGFGDTFYIDEVFAGVPDHSDQWQAALSMESRRPRWRGC
jgi:putative transposase